MVTVAEKRIRLGAVSVGIAVDPRRADSIRRSAPYRYLLRPTIGRLTGRAAPDGPAAPAEERPDRPPPRPLRAPDTPAARAIVERINGVEWYHSIELPHGVVTPGFADHRDQVDRYGLPADMRGMRALDVATYDGFWAFEMERRGAEVTAIDIASWAEFDIPRYLRGEAERAGAAEKITGQGFRLAHELLGSRVERRILSVYELAPEKVGTFDVVFLSDLLLHLRDPQRALENVASVTREGGFAIVADVYSPALDAVEDKNLTEFVAFGNYVWWLPSVRTLRTMMRLAGFARTDELARFCLSSTSLTPIHKVVLKGYPTAQEGA